MSGASYGVSSGACLGIAMGHVWGIIRSMSRASSGACLGHHLGHVWGIICSMSGECLGQSKISAVIHASLMLFLIVTEIHNIHEFSEGVKMHLC